MIIDFYDSIATSTIYRRYAKYLKESNVREIVIYEFRHSHAPYLLNMNSNHLVLANHLRYSDVAETLNTLPFKTKESCSFH